MVDTDQAEIARVRYWDGNSTLQDAIDSAATDEGRKLVLPPQSYDGPITLPNHFTLEGASPAIHNPSGGSLPEITADGDDVVEIGTNSTIKNIFIESFDENCYTIVDESGFAQILGCRVRTPNATDDAIRLDASLSIVSRTHFLNREILLDTDSDRCIVDTCINFGGETDNGSNNVLGNNSSD